MRNLTLRQLRSIVRIAEEGKIASAAKYLGVTAPAVTLQLQALEEELGTSLFDRTTAGMRPTAAGLAAIDAAHAIEEQLLLLAERIDAIRGVRRGHLRLGVVSTAKYFAPRIIAEFGREFPGLDIDLKVGNRAEIIGALSDHAVDIALMGRPPKNIPVRAQVFGDHPLVIISAPDHPLAGARDISRERIAKERFLVREPGSGTRISLEVFFAPVPSKLENIGSEMGSNETIKQAVMAGLGVAFISAHTIEAEVQAGRLRVLDVEGTPIRRQWFAVSRSDRSPTSAGEAFLTFLSQKGAQYLPLALPLYRRVELPT
ncbi:HTH-type transcriptional regulator cbbR [Pseudorhizobium banfieldiae]|uniref:HTH-type transcriptional regulator CbbR n=1 Tax=Pseudorhizobium banfieldiae TaxID=1125847 RepID=L0NBZ0_9HYPH|nr:LysR family transcriptional regulator [Pseudorhizobium banfieldiae]CAD6602238.1 LysR family transcriptional regulator [arsenite-oxidising bacterium NT-25]CCF18399.1 HTH-type transcriptional regulator cbbR [Pseudorhizobium banfieldiae]